MSTRKSLFGLALAASMSAAVAASLPTPRAGVTATAAAAQPPAGVQLANGDEVTIGTWNIKFFYDDETSDNATQLAKKMSAPSKEKYQERVKLTAAAVAKIKPTVLGLTEIENKKVVEDLAAALKTNHQLEYLVGFVQGKDTATEQDVAFLYDKRFGEQTFLRAEDAGLGDLSNGNLYKVPSKHVGVRIAHVGPNGQQQALTMIVCHLKAGGGTGNEAQRVRQSRVLNRWAAKCLAAGEAVIVLGDVNAGRRFDQTSASDGMGVLRGMETTTLVDDLFDLNDDLAVADRRTHITGKELDRIVVSPNLLDDVGLAYQSTANFRHLVVRGQSADDDANKTFYDYALDEADLSDHYPLVAKFKYLP
ncbi:Endonuclease/exonuclease/phosphatase OS=Pirellula staleyi (strain ATCC 27377 / DSM 6068 / ICPB 4128) GN=Psta_1922 PE=4 SV=1: Exo_endo_phos [Gemmataceae bacterium]|nr:Endonuclease/exonuclease/phosphatase OS=Pirellula staleyi (strain ATCC 27377 / DSM 6068 / ICPB 4128) GN=Psta_1922 PE=4 SV=1: Exo_endo_phos [Gemmataceae bacterium]VTT99098.1 Endonuclease/exonuclease/phosphatase OS=Pirellula staleyi (strain ATCC 27377 / DSM 6068 / ICPB 4128) GN=Psta_1922 PE=4 SV=1: Exo_endo_phos [Gemmataceae bacterium]